MSKRTPVPAIYLVQHHNLSRPTCTWMKQYFELTLDGRLASVSVYEDGGTWACATHATICLSGVLCTRADFRAAQLQHTRYLRKQQQQERDRKGALKLLRGGMQRHEHASREAGATATSPELVAVVAAPAPAPVVPADVLADYTVFDVETTGFSPDRDSLLEIAATRITGGVPMDSMQSFVRFEGGVPPRITQLTGIQTSHVAKAPPLKQVLQEFKRVAGDSLLVGHNVGFDLRFVNAARASLGAREPLPNPFLCTQVLAKWVLPKATSYKLGDLCRHFNISAVKAHRAGADVLMTAKLLQQLHAKRPILPALVNATSVPQAPAAAGPDLFAPAA